MSVQELFTRFHEIASSPRAQMETYLAQGKKVVLTAPVYTPEALCHAMGLVPMGTWGADLPLSGSKEYFPTFLCSVVQSILELGMGGAYEGASALIVPSLCDSLKCLGENWKYAVPSIPFVPMTYPQNRAGDVGRAFTRAGCERVAADLERITGAKLTPAALSASIRVYNRHNAAMRRASAVFAAHPEVTAAQRSSVFQSAFFLLKEEHTALVETLLAALEAQAPSGTGLPIVTSGILCDSPGLLELFDDLGYQIAADDVAAESRQYRTDAPEQGDPLDALAVQFSQMGDCSVLYDPDKTRADLIVSQARERGARGVVVVLTKFCDPEEFDWPLVKRACDAAGLPALLLEVDRQMEQFEQARTALETFRDILGPAAPLRKAGF